MKLGQAQPSEPKCGRQVNAARRDEDQGKPPFHVSKIGQAWVFVMEDGTDAPQELDVVWAFDHDQDLRLGRGIASTKDRKGLSQPCDEAGRGMRIHHQVLLCFVCLWRTPG
jgi:hypothetical protein